MIRAIFYWLRTKRTPRQIAKLYSKLICLDLDSPVATNACVLDTHGLTLELQREGHCYYVTETQGGKALNVTEATIKNDLVYYKHVATPKECSDYQWVKLLIEVDKEFTSKNFYLKRQRELMANMVSGL